MFRHLLVIVVITHRELPRVHDVDRLVTDALGHSSTLRESCPYEQARIHRTLGLYVLATWSPHGSFMGVPLWACPYATHMGPLWACPLWAQCAMYTDLPIWAWYLGHTWAIYGFAL